MAKYGTFAAVIGNGATFLGSVTAWPTTTLTMALYNPTSDRVYKLKRAAANFISGTVVVGGALLACVTGVAQARPTLSTGANGGYAGTVISQIGSRGVPGDTQGVFINAITLTGPQPAWFPIGWELGSAGTTISLQGIMADVEGLGMEVLPGHMAGFTVVSAAGTGPLYSYTVIWDED